MHPRWDLPFRCAVLPRLTVLLVAAILALSLCAVPAQPVQSQTTAGLDPSLMTTLRFRELGPAVAGGRVHDVEAVPTDPSVIYVGAASGGVWKSVDGGTKWRPLWDELPNSSVGDIALAPSDPQILYVGTGGPNNRQSTLYGNGVWRSTDGGETWSHLGLVETRHVGRIRVHPTDPDIVYVAAMGNLWSANDERGVFKSTDGGRTWQKVLYVDDDTGAVDLVMDPSDPQTLYAATYQRRRRTWGFNGGGPGSGIWKTSNGGADWTELTTGLPRGDKGRIGLAISMTEPTVLNATVEHGTESGTYRSEDGGRSWERVNRLNPRPMYYSHIYIDPTNADRVYVLGTSSSVSDDGGRTFRTLPTSITYDVGVHADHHALWIDPGDPDHLILGGDAGIYVSWDQGTAWQRFNNFTIGQFYGIGVDMREPYWVYGGMQDNHSWMGPSRTRRVIGIINDDWNETGFGDGMYSRPDPVDHRRVYINSNGGNISRFDPETGGMIGIRPQAPDGERYRWDWTAPILISPHDHMRIYTGGNRLFISDDGGDSWRSTEDLTRQIDRDTLLLMGESPGQEILSRHDGASSYGEITTIDESPLRDGLLWVGTDDGNVQVSRDGGTSWTNVSGNFRGVPDRTYVSRVEASHHVAERAYVTFDAHRDGDFRPFVFVTEDQGQTWRMITGGLPDEGSVNVIVEHHLGPNLLFVGTEHALFVSLDRGANWIRLKNGLSTTPIDDLVIHPRDNDLVVGTHGRGIWVLENLTPLNAFSEAVASRPLHLFPIRSPMQWQKWKATSYRGHGEYMAAQAVDGAVIDYWLADPVAGGVQIEVTTADGRVVSSLAGSGEAGIQRVVWDLRMALATGRGGGGGGGGRGGGRTNPNTTPWLEETLASRGPYVLPATYTVTVRAGGYEVVSDVVVRPDPMDRLTAEERERRWEFILAASDLPQEAGEWAEMLRDLDGRIQAAISAAEEATPVPGDIVRDLSALRTTVQGLSGQVGSRQFQRSASGLTGSFTAAASRQGTLEGPTAAMWSEMEQIRLSFAVVREQIAAMQTERIVPLDRRLRAAGLPTIGGGN